MSTGSTGQVDDMDFSNDGRFMLTQVDGRVSILDSDLHAIRSFNTTDYYFSQSFGSFIVPEPSCLTLAAIAAVVCFAASIRHYKAGRG
jgi:hypothetical protein